MFPVYEEKKRKDDRSDRAALKDISQNVIPEIICNLTDMKSSREKIWMNNAKPFGYEILDIKIGGVITRLKSTGYRIDNYLNGNVLRLEELEEEIGILSWPKSILFIVGGALAIAFGGDLTVDAASRIAIDLGMSQTLVGLTIVSIGTSLPELVTSVVAARKNEVDMAVGNAVGSNIFNILMVLGVASAINPVALIRENIIDIVILIVFSLIVWIYAATKQRISRKEGISMVCMYLIYAGYIIWR